MANLVSLNEILKYIRQRAVFNSLDFINGNTVIEQIKVNTATLNNQLQSSVLINTNSSANSIPYTWTFDSNGNLLTPASSDTSGYINGVKLTNDTNVRNAVMNTGNSAYGVVETSPVRIFVGNAGGRRIYSDSDSTLWIVNNRDEKPSATWIKNYYDTNNSAYRQRYSNKIYSGNSYNSGSYYSASMDFFHYNAGSLNNTAKVRFEAFYKGSSASSNTYRMLFSLRQNPTNMSYLQFNPHTDSGGDGSWHNIADNYNFSNIFIDTLGGSETTDPLFWSNTNNKIAIRLGNTTDNHSWGLYVQNTGISLNSYNSAGTSTTTTWTIRPDEYITRNITVSASDLSVEAGRTTVGALYRSVDYDIAQISGYTPVSVTLSAEFSSARYYPILVVNAAKTKIYFRLYNSTTATAWTTTTNGQITVLYKKN